MRVMKASVKGRYELEKSSAVATLAFNAGDVCLKASLTDATFTKGPSLSGLALSLDKPGAFLIDYNVPKNDIRFQFMNSVRVMEKQVNLTYTHAYGDRRTAVDAAVVFDPANKVSASYAFGSGDSKVKYVYAHGEARRTVLEPTYDVAKNSWDLAVTRKFDAGDSVRATYGTSSKILGLEWNRESKFTGCFKISASVNLAEQNIVPRVVAESTWNYEI